MIRTLIWGFQYDLGQKIIFELKKNFNVVFEINNHNEKDLDLQKTILGISSLNYNIDQATLKNFHNFRDKYLHTFQIMMSSRKQNDKSSSEVLNEFTILYYYFFDLFKKKKIELSIFSVLPHQGPEYIIYQLSREMNIKTLFCTASILPNKFWITKTVEDFGKFLDIPKINSSEINLNRKAYTSKMDQRFSKIGNKKKLLDFKIEKRIFKNILLMFLKKLKLIQRKDLNEEYLLNLKKITKSDKIFSEILKSKKKLIYFPLSFQPELSTSGLGEGYKDQLFAIESLASIMDDNWLILIKENPMQTHFQRGEMFFKRLKNIRNVVIVDRMIKSEYLIKNTNITATIAGNAGWEAVLDSKKCLFFGNAWYQSLHGCMKFNQDTTLHEIEKFSTLEFDKMKFEKDLSNLLSKMGTGIVEPFYEEFVDDYDLEKNAIKVCSYLSKVAYTK